MSTVTKIMCDRCKDIIDMNNDYYYVVENDINRSFFFNRATISKTFISKGDYCQRCFYELFKEKFE